MGILVVDVGTSSIRTVVVAADGTTSHEHRRASLPTTPRPGLTEFDPVAMAEITIGLATETIAAAGPVDAIALTTQRASTVVWDGATGVPVGPGIGWQDLRTVRRCVELQRDGVAVAPNLAATKAEWLLAHTDVPAPRLRFGTLDTWLAWCLSDGAIHVTDASSAAMTGLYDPVAHRWRLDVAVRLGLPESALPDLVDTMGIVGAATAVTGAPPIAALVADQSASLIGQGAVRPGAAKITFGTGAMADVCVGADLVRSPSTATFPIVAWRNAGRSVYGLEAVALSAGSAVEWLRDGLGLIDSTEESATIAAQVPDADGVVFVPALAGLGSPDWDHTARGLLIGITRGTTRAHVVRAVLEGVAHRGCDLLEAVEVATGRRLDQVCVDGGMTANVVFVQALADAALRPVAVSDQREATALGAGFAAGVAIGIWPDLPAATATVRPRMVIDPGADVDEDRHAEARRRFAQARTRARGWTAPA